jgi:hypothetical protein
VAPAQDRLWSVDVIDGTSGDFGAFDRWLGFLRRRAARVALDAVFAVFRVRRGAVALRDGSAAGDPFAPALPARSIHHRTAPRRDDNVPVAVQLLLAYAYLVDALLSFYGNDRFERATALHRFTGAWAWPFWGAVALNVLVPQMLWQKRLRRNAWIVCAVAFGVIIGMWLERIILVASSLYRDFLPSAWGRYAGTTRDWMTLFGSAGMTAAAFLLIIRYAPVVAVFEFKEILPPAERRG